MHADEPIDPKRRVEAYLKAMMSDKTDRILGIDLRPEDAVLLREALIYAISKRREHGE